MTVTDSCLRIPVVFAVDTNYVVGTGVAICSLLMVASDELYDFFILHSSDLKISDRDAITNDVARLSPHSRVSFIEMGDDFNDAYTEKWFGISCYYRLMIPWIIPNYSKVIYSDSDIIFKTSLKNLFETFELEDSYVAGINYDRFQDPKSQIYDHIIDMGLSPKEYINSGFILINNDLQRQHNLLEKYKKLMYLKHQCPDQDVLNKVCKGRISYIDHGYNVYPGLKKNKTRKDKVLHYIGRHKPWTSLTWRWNEWAKVYKQTSFFEPAFYRDMKKKRIKNMFRKPIQYSYSLLHRVYRSLIKV